MGTIGAGLPHIDDHALRLTWPPDVVYPVLRQYVGTLGFTPRGFLSRLWAADPATGFAVAEETPGSLVRLTGRHRFSEYELVFDLADAADGGCVLRARSYGAFPGLHGRAYRTLVVGTRLHVLATRHLLRSVRRTVSRTRA